MMRRLTAADGHELDCFVEPAQGDRLGGLVILQEIFGVTDQLKALAGRYAALGYEVAVPALFDRKEREAVVPFEQFERGRDLMLSLDQEDNIADIDAAVRLLGENGGVATMGFCWGGALAVRTAQVSDVVGAISFYGTRLQLYMDRPLKAPLLCHFGATDDHTPPEIVEQFRAKFPQAEVHMYDAGHAFANDARSSYVPEAAELAHQRSQAFLARLFS